ncbi:HNH endonuclease [Nocardiopsis sp. YSL2]|uniref:HNH endonuclease n=1 Tax=Nocardiopsis sp. YSL2 TaxID=2939492 RepID=UPI0026F451ED|nr:HNH endonuclease [Nocardiopsis sp. YSL2]
MDSLEYRRGRSGRPLARAKAKLKREGSNLCWRCGGAIDMQLTAVAPNHADAWTLDHLTPLSQGGSALDPANHREAHRRCNSARGNRADSAPAQQVNSRNW